MVTGAIIENIEFSEEWLIEQLIKTDFEEKSSGKTIYARIKKIDLYKLFLQFIKLVKD